ncbi:MAG: hypothetical protein E7252_07565 [Lachnospira sp.]|nr:hypothetical protein [Lachnospira sp.]
MKNKFIIIFILILLVANPSLCAVGGYEGLCLWFDVIIPTLLPFMIISNILVNSNNVGSNANNYAAFIGVMCGYPMGAQISGELYKNNIISKKAAYISFCMFNMASPAFIVTYIGKYCLNRLSYVPYIFFAIYAPSVILYLILRYKYSKHFIKNEYINKNSQSIFKIIDNAIYAASMTLIKLGGYIIVFSIIACMIKKIPLESELLKAIVIAFVEITNGINFIAQSDLPFMYKYILASAFTSFGGLSCIAQTKCILLGCNLSIKKYIYCKLILASLTALLAFTIYVLLN